MVAGRHPSGRRLPRRSPRADLRTEGLAESSVKVGTGAVLHEQHPAAGFLRGRESMFPKELLKARMPGLIQHRPGRP
jgi:hypothetical protein